MNTGATVGILQMTEDNSVTAKKLQPGIPFKKGYDPRRNIRGVPKEAIQARKFFRKIGAELITIKEKQENGEDVEYEVTRLEDWVRSKFGGKSSKDFETVIKILYPGLLKDEVDVNNKGEVKVIIEYSDDQTSETAPGAEASKE